MSIKNFRLTSLLLTIMILFDLIFIYYCLIHGIGFGDAIYPISLCHNIINGNIPLVNSWSCYPGFIFLAPIIQVYKLFNNGYEGVAYFYKILYYIFMIFNIYIFYKFICIKSKDNRLINLAIAVLINSFIFISWGGLSYSYIFIVFNMYCSFIMYVYDDAYFNKILLSIVSAILMFIMTMFYPTAFIVAIFWTALIYIKNYKSDDKIRIVISYVITGAILSIIYLITLLFFARGHTLLFKSIFSIFNSPHNILKMDLLDSIIINFKKYWKYVVALFLVFYVLIIVSRKSIRNIKLIVLDSYIFIFMFLFLSLVYYLSSDQQNFILTIIMTISFFATFCLLYTNDNIIHLKSILVVVFFLIIPFYIWYIAPKYLGSIPNYKNDKYIESGIYKGLYTNNDDYEFITSLEKDLKDYFRIDKPDICEITVFPATYLMTDANVIAPDTWDCMELHVANIESWVNERNIPIPIPSYPLTNYFEYFKIKPQYLVAVDYYVRDFKNNNHKYEINNFIDEYYCIDYEKEYNLSRLIIYKIK